ncbi:MAG: stalk domain-containing protein, partial [Hominilimicola sp.]
MKKISAIILAVVMLSSSAQAAYVPLRATFEEKGYTVTWTEESPDDVIVGIGDYSIEFQNQTNTIEVDDGTFQTEQNTYIEEGTTYISEDAVSLCDNLYLYHNAIVDCIQADEDEILPLRPIDTTADKVLVCTWHKYPDSYPSGEEIEIKYGDVWVFAADEIMQFGNKNGYSDDMVLRMTQLIGLPPQNGKTHFTTM